MLWSMGSQRVRQLSNWTELNWKCTEYKILEWELLDFSLRKFHSLHSLKHLQVVGNSQSSALILMKHPQHTLEKMHFFTSSLSLSVLSFCLWYWHPRLFVQARNINYFPSLHTVNSTLSSVTTGTKAYPWCTSNFSLFADRYSLPCMFSPSLSQSTVAIPTPM